MVQRMEWKLALCWKQMPSVYHCNLDALLKMEPQLFTKGFAALYIATVLDGQHCSMPSTLFHYYVVQQHYTI